VVRITTPHIPLAANPIREDAQMPSAERIADTIRRTMAASH
jgi:pyruvate/2-oxoglutarate/acetoin dehydrogenase E1 component